MRNFTLGLLLVLFSSSLLYGQLSDEMQFANETLESRGEFYFTFEGDSRDQILEIGEFLSIDNVQGTTVYAYANVNTWEQFKEYHIQFTPVYEYYNTSKALTMATATAEMAGWDRYPTHAVYLQMLDDFVAGYPNLCRVETIGYSENGVPIKCLVISDNISTDEDEPEFWWSGTMHGDEITGYVLLLRYADYLLSNYGSISQVTDLVDNIEIYINPLANPDGTFNNSPSLVSVSSASRENGNNTDLNRNFPKISGVATIIDSEIQCMMDYCDIHDFVMSANTHGGIELMNYPWDNWQTWENIHPDNDWWEYVCFKYATSARDNSPSTYFTGPGSMDYPNGTTNTTGVTHGANWYYAYGSRQDYMNYFENIREVTVELSDTKSLDVSDLNDYWGYNRQALLDYTEQVLNGFRGIVTNACTGAVLDGVKVEIVGHDQDNTEVYSSAPVGNYHRPILAGTYDVTFSLIGYQDKTISVTVANDASTRLDVELIPKYADFTAIPTSIFEGETVDFTDASLGIITSRAWAFEGGSPTSSTVTNPSNILYATAGVYDVTLEIVSNGCTVSELKTDYITVAEAVPVVTGFTADATNVSQGTIVNFTDLSNNNPDTWTWTFSGGTPGTSTDQNPAIVYNTPGTYDVTLTATNIFGGNAETKLGYITVTEADLIMSNGTSTRCSGLFKDDGGDLDYTDQATLTHTIYPSTSGAFVRLTFTELNIEEDGTADCYDYITIYDGEDNLATEIGTYCHNDYTAVGTSGVVTSTDASGALTIYFSSDNNTNESGWVAEISCYSPTDPPVADFTSDVANTCTGVVQFEDLSIGATSWSWNFGDGSSTSSDSDPIHTYTANGTYTVGLTATNAYGTNVHEIIDMIVVDMPVAPITTNAQSCGPASLTLNASGSGTLVWYDAPIGGTEITTGTSYTNTFSSTSTLYVQSGISPEYFNGGSSDISINGGNHTSNGFYLIFTANEDFRLVSVQVNSTTDGDRIIELRNSSDVVIDTHTANLSTGINTVELNFDIQSGTDYQLKCGTATPNLWRNNAGTSWPYIVDDAVSITGTNAGDDAYYYYFYNWEIMIGADCTSARTPVVATIDEVPTVELGAPVTQCGGTVDLDAGSGMSSYTWNGTVGSQTYTATTTNSYSVVVENAAGCTATDNVQVTINDVPATVVVSGGGTQCGGSITLTADNGGDGTIYWQNTTSDGTSTATASASQTVSVSGTYYFRAQSAEGCWGDEGSTIVIINDLPADVVVSGGGSQCGGSMILTADNGGEGTIYWQNTTSNGINTGTISSSETVSSDGTYYFRAQSDEGCWGNEGSASVIFYPIFTVSASSTDETNAGAIDGSVIVDMTGGSPDYNGVWSYGSATNTSGTSMTQFGLTGGYYSVTVTDDNGCTATDGAIVNTSGSAPVAALEADFTMGCDNLTVQFTDLSNNTPTSWAWDFGDGSLTSSDTNPSHTYTTPGTYSVSLTVTNAFGTDNTTVVDYITFGETPVLVMSMAEETIAGNDGTATVAITGGVSPYAIVWSNFGDTEMISGLVAGNYCVSVTEFYGCTAVECITVTSVSLNLPVADFSSDETEGCGSVDVQFTDLSSNNPTEWAWDFGDGSSTSSDTNPSHTYDVVGIYTVTLTVTNVDGDGEIILTDYIEVFSQPTLDLVVTQESGAGVADGEIDMTIVDGTGPFTINWSNDMHDALITGLTAALYSVAVVDDNGCMATGMAEVTVYTALVDGQKVQISVYPNPNNGQFSIAADENIDNILIFDSLGRLVLNQDVNSNSVSIDSSLKPGLYHIRIIQSDNTYDSKIIVK